MSKPNRNYFDLSHDVKMTCNLGELIPTCLVECVPGDKFSLEGNALVRFAPLIAPVMHQLNCTIHYFFVPKRIMWAGWEKWITGDPDAGLHPTVTLPQVADAWNDYGTLGDYLGLPIPDDINTPDQNETVSAFPFMAYQKVWYEFYRDQNNITITGDMEGLMEDGLSDGDNTAQEGNLNTLRRRAWEHDYFTACLPFAQKGTAVNLPIGASTIEVNPDKPSGSAGTFRNATGDSASTGDIENLAATGVIASGSVPQYYDPQGTLISGATDTTINELRRAYALQRWLEKNARGGTRYAEHILMHFGVKSSDARLQRPEYITGSRSPVQISEVLATATNESASIPQGNMAGHAISVNAGNYGTYFCEEHGYIIGIMSIMPKPAYRQGIARHWQKVADATQHYWVDFAHIGEQEVLKTELYAYKDHEEPTFGYIPRYSEYKYEPSRISGEFRNTLGYWTFGRVFDGDGPVLNAEFIECNPTNDPFAVISADEDHLYCHVYNKIGASRLMPKFGNPI